MKEPEIYEKIFPKNFDSIFFVSYQPILIFLQLFVPTFQPAYSFERPLTVSILNHKLDYQVDNN